MLIDKISIIVYKYEKYFIIINCYIYHIRFTRNNVFLTYICYLMHIYSHIDSIECQNSKALSYIDIFILYLDYCQLES